MNGDAPRVEIEQIPNRIGTDSTTHFTVRMDGRDEVLHTINKDVWWEQRETVIDALRIVENEILGEPEPTTGGGVLRPKPPLDPRYRLNGDECRVHWSASDGGPIEYQIQQFTDNVGDGDCLWRNVASVELDHAVLNGVGPPLRIRSVVEDFLDGDRMASDWVLVNQDLEGGDPAAQSDSATPPA